MLVAQAFNWMLDAEGDEQCWADARLIACAPELLEALKALCTHAPRSSQQIDADWDKARAAIAKAEGQA
jgi:hypothetical protein